MRLPYAMRAMIDEISKTHSRGVVETRNPDGFGVWRTLVLDQQITADYYVLLDELIDPRIAGREVKDEQYYVHFVPDHRADDATPFHLDRAMAVLRTPDAVTIEEIVEDEEDEDAARDLRAELQGFPVARLREEFTLSDGTTFGPKDKKRDIIDAILTDKGL